MASTFAVPRASEPCRAVVADQDRLVGAHGEGGAQPADLAVGGHGDQRDLAPARGLDELERHFHAVLVGRVEHQLAGAVQGVGGRIQLPGTGRVGHLLDTNRNIHGSVVLQCGRYITTQ